MFAFLVCCLILFLLLRKVFDGLCSGGNNMQRVEGGWIINPGGRVNPYFIRDEIDNDDDEKEDEDFEDFEEEEDDPSIVERIYLWFRHIEIEAPEYQRAIKLKEGDRLLLEYDNPESMNYEDVDVLTEEDHVFIGHPSVCPNFINFLINDCHYTLETVVTGIFHSMSKTGRHGQLLIHTAIKKVGGNVLDTDVNGD